MSLASLGQAGRAPALPLSLELADAAGTATLTLQRLLRVLPGQRYVAEAEWRGRPVLAKLLVGGKAARHFQRELTGARLLAEQGLPTPQLLADGLREVAGEGEVMAWLGPCIGPEAFEVGAEVCEAFIGADAEAAAHFWPSGEGKFLADLPALARRRLAAAGVTDVHGNDGRADWCTVSQASRFFSHRRDAGRLGSTGRMAACIWVG